MTLSDGAARFGGTTVSRVTFGGLSLPDGSYGAPAVISDWILGASKRRGLSPTYDHSGDDAISVDQYVDATGIPRNILIEGNIVKGGWASQRGIRLSGSTR